SDVRLGDRGRHIDLVGNLVAGAKRQGLARTQRSQGNPRSCFLDVWMTFAVHKTNPMQFDQLHRREFITLLGGATAAWPLAARAQQSPIRPLIGVLSPLSAAEGVQNTNAFRSALRELGYIEGRNATVELRYANGEADRMGALTRELVAFKPDVLFVGSAPGLVAARNATRTIPIVTIVP